MFLLDHCISLHGCSDVNRLLSECSCRCLLTCLSIHRSLCSVATSSTISQRFLRDFITYARAVCKPQLGSLEVQQLLVQHYLDMRHAQQQGRGAGMLPHAMRHGVYLCRSLECSDREDAIVRSPSSLCSHGSSPFLMMLPLCIHYVCACVCSLCMLIVFCWMYGSLGSAKTISATPRQLESLIRLSQARAKMRLSAVVTAEDVRCAARYTLQYDEYAFV